MSKPTETVVKKKRNRPNLSIYIGKAYDYWQEYKQSNSLNNDTATAFHLLSMCYNITSASTTAMGDDSTATGGGSSTVTCGESTTSMGSDSTSVGDIKSLVDITVHRPQHAPTSKDVAPSSSKSKFTATCTPLPKKLSIKELGTDDSSSSSVNPCEDISGVSSIRSSPEWLSDGQVEKSTMGKDCSDISYRPTDESIKVYNSEVHNNDIHYHMLDYEPTEQEEDQPEVEIPAPQTHPFQHNAKIISNAADMRNEVPFIGYLSSLVDVIKDKICNKCGKTMHPAITTFSTAAEVTWKCQNRKCGTKSRWYSQPFIKDNRGILLANFKLAMSIPLSGNYYSKISLLLKFMGLQSVASQTYYSIQAHYVQPTVEKEWRKEQHKLSLQMAGKALVVAADGRCDSPGHCAHYTTYTVMEHTTHNILCSVVVDKREVGLKSPNMEKLGLERALDELKSLGFNIVEMVTDAHIQVPPVLVARGIHHSWDVWHGGKNLAKKIREVAKKKANHQLEPWIKDIVNHFWYSSKEAHGDSLQFKSRFLGCLRHIVDVHEWATGQCDHQAEIEQDKEYLVPGSAPHEALTEICRSSNWLDKASKKFANFRHTSELESHHNVMLKYASKRFSFGYREYTCRMQLAALDHQNHMERKSLKDDNDNLRYTAVYSKKTDVWTPVIIKEQKTYDHIPALQEKILNVRLLDHEKKRRPANVADHDPSRIQPNLAPRPAPPLDDLVAIKKSRYQ